jgi:hypothetical protein
VHCPAQIGFVVGVAVTETGRTVTVAEAVAVQPFAAVTVTVYVVVAAGQTLIVAMEPPGGLLHEYVPPPVAVILVHAPWHIVAGLAVAVAVAVFTVMVTLLDAVHPKASVTVRLYVVVESGQAVGFAIEPLDSVPFGLQLYV